MQNGITPLRLFSPYPILGLPALGFAMAIMRIASSISQFFSNILALFVNFPRSVVPRSPVRSASPLLRTPRFFPPADAGNKLDPNTI